MNILIKLTCLIGLVIAPILGAKVSAKNAAAQEVKTEQVTAQDVEIQGAELHLDLKD